MSGYPESAHRGATDPARDRWEALMLDRSRFNEEFEWFRRLIPRRDEGRAFTSFDEGVVERWEGYKPRVRRRARDILAFSAWTEAEIGSGMILQRMIDAVEIEENNLVTWQDRRGPGSSDHRVLLDARRDANLRLELERRLFDLFRGVADEGATFGLLKDALGAKYPLLAYIFFLKDMRRFMPIRPTFFDSAFRDLGIDLVTARKDSDRYRSSNFIEGRACSSSRREIHRERARGRPSATWSPSRR